MVIELRGFACRSIAVLSLVLLFIAGMAQTDDAKKAAQPGNPKPAAATEQARPKQEPEAELRGKTFFGHYTGRKHKPETKFNYALYIPAEYDGKTPAALLVVQDGMNPVQPAVVDRLIAEGAMPVCVIVAVSPGALDPTLPGGVRRGQRADEYDHLGRDYPDFLIEELIPHVAKEHGLKFSDSPDMHMICGGSSGGSCAWNAAWYRNDFFHRVYLSSPSFIAFRGQEELVTLARKCETKPIRVYMTVGSSEPNQYAGNSRLVALSAESAMKYAGYDLTFEDFVGGHCFGYRDFEIQQRIFRRLWQDWRTEPIKPPRFQPRIAEQIDITSKWERTDEAMPGKPRAKTAAGTYTFQSGQIFFTATGGAKKVVAGDFDEIAALAVSSDRWRLYIADRARRYVFAMSINPDGTLQSRYKLAHLHLAADCRVIGAMDLCVDTCDRVYAATELGIQGIISFGIVDSIIPLPGGLPINALAFGGQKGNVMYAKSGNQVFKRQWNFRGLRDDDPIIQPSTPTYNDSYTPKENTPGYVK